MVAGLVLIVLVIVGGVVFSRVETSCGKWGRFLYIERDVEDTNKLVVLEDGEKTVVPTKGRIHYADFSPEGDRVVVSAARGGVYYADFGWENETPFLYTVGIDGDDYELLIDGEDANQPRWSPDGNQILFIRSRGIWTVDLETSEKKVVFELPPSDEVDPDLVWDAVWSGDSKRIAFLVSDFRGVRGEVYSLWTMNRDGTDRELILKERPEADGLAWSPDGDTFMWEGWARDTFFLKSASLPDKKVKLVEPFAYEPMWSDDGRRLAYVIGHEGHYSYRIVVGNADGSDPRSVPGTPTQESHLMLIEDWSTSC